MLKKLSLKILTLAILLGLLNFIYSKFFYEKDIQKYSEVLNLVRKIPLDTDIIYIGESSNVTFRSDDIDKRPISDFLGDYYQNLKISDITKPASHAGIYKVLLEKVPKENEAKTLIVTLNLRSFNAQWIYSKLETQLQKSLVLIKNNPPLFNRFLLSFKAYDIKTDKERVMQFRAKWKKDQFHLPYDFPFADVMEWDKHMADSGIRNESGVYDNPQTELACHFIKAYGFQVDTIHNPRIDDFNEIIKIAKKRDWNLVFNLLAENTEKAEMLVGKDLNFMINENTNILTRYFENKGVVVVNNINSVKDEYFIDQNWTTEHYSEKGRKIIAKNVADTLKRWHNNSFVKVNYQEDYQTNFFNNCDSSVIWGQMHTITSERAYSGSKSSMVGDGNDYSITLEYPFTNIPDSLKNNLNVEFWVYQLSLKNKSQFVVQAEGNDVRYWKGYGIINEVDKINVWQKYKKKIIFPDSIKKAGLIKLLGYQSKSLIV